MIAGFTSGLFGVGGGIVIVPALAMLAGFPHTTAVGTSLTAVVPISVAAAIGYATAGELEAAYALCIASGALAGAVIGTRWLRTWSGPALQLTFAAFAVLTAIRLVVGDEGDGAGQVDLTVGTVASLVLLGVASGVLAGLMGVGGGIIIVPVLTIVFGMPLVLAKGTSLLVIIPTAVVGTLRNRAVGLTLLRPAAIVGVSGIATAAAASQLSLSLDTNLSALLFAGLLLAVAVRLAVTALRADNTADGDGSQPHR